MDFPRISVSSWARAKLALAHGRAVAITHLSGTRSENVRESRDPRWQLEQHREQLALLEPEQQRPDEREQPHRFSCREAHERAAGPSQAA